MFITAYTAVCEPVMGKLPVEESIESLYDHVDAFVVYDCSKYDRIDLSKYGKVKRHVRGIWNPFDNPFGSMFTNALRLVDSDTALFLDIDEIFEFHAEGLKDIVKKYPMESGAGVAFSLLNYFCSRNFKIDGCSSKGPHVFRNRDNLSHDLLQGYWQPVSQIRRTNMQPDGCDGVRLVNEQGIPMSHYPPIPLDVVTIHHTSHLDPLSKMVRSVLQFNHTSTIDIPLFAPYDMRIPPKAVERIYEAGTEKIKDKSMVLYGNAMPHDYKKNELLEAYIERTGILEFDPTGFEVETNSCTISNAEESNQLEEIKSK
jgi:hypothetical protein